jgi:predicted nucleic acid-binding protein
MNGYLFDTDALSQPLKKRPSPVFEHWINEIPFELGALRAGLEKNGVSVASHDLMIASIALSANLVLVTGNTRHFKRIPDLVVEDWIQG